MIFGLVAPKIIQDPNHWVGGAEAANSWSRRGDCGGRRGRRDQEGPGRLSADGLSAGLEVSSTDVPGSSW